MEELEDIRKRYEAQQQQAQQKATRIQRRIYHIGTLRLLLIAAGIAGLVYARAEGWQVLTSIAAATLAPFLWLVKHHNRLFRRKEYLETEAELNSQELAAMGMDYGTFDDGKEFADPTHLYAYDLDVYGKHSLFQYMNRTCTQPGRTRLAAWLGRHLEEKKAIEERQEAIRELAAEVEFRQRFRILGLLHKGQAADEEELCTWARSESTFRRRKALRLLPPLVVALNIAGISAIAADLLPGTLYGGLWTGIVIVAFRFTHRISRLQAVYGKRLQVLSTYAVLLHSMEERKPRAWLLKEIHRKISHEERKASQAIGQLDRMMNALDQRNNMIMYALLNGFFFWELRQFMRIEQWREQYAECLPHWLEAIGETDALCSLATFAYNHPDYSFPTLLGKEEVTMAENGKVAMETELTKNGFRLCADGLGHPLMARERCVRNGINMMRRPAFIIITGANMAGKSTYLRTVGVNYLLACIGAPVCAESMEIYPARLITSLRTSDSLTDNESYFFAELKRLKLIIDKLQSGEELFIILDEILKGTNSLDKQKGSFALIRQLMELRANGIIATHDLLLGRLIDLYPDDISNFCFEADIKNDELTFAYRLRPGVAQNMNACFLMKRMGIAVTD